MHSLCSLSLSLEHTRHEIYTVVRKVFNCLVSLIECEQECVDDGTLQKRRGCNNWQIKRNGKTLHTQNTYKKTKKKHKHAKWKEWMKHAFTFQWWRMNEKHTISSLNFWRTAKWHVKKAFRCVLSHCYERYRRGQSERSERTIMRDLLSGSTGEKKDKLALMAT